jgi:phage replication O-like protein O
MAFESPNYTQIPNDLMGDWTERGLMAEMGEAELKVTLAVCRLTFGYHREQVRASISVLQTMTGLTRQGTINGIRAAEQRGVIEHQAEHGKTATWRALVTSQPGGLETSQRRGPDERKLVNAVDGTSQRNRHMKERKKEIPNEKNGVSLSEIKADPLAELWSTILSDLRGTMTGATFEMWFERTRAVERNNGCLVVDCPNPQAREWLGKRWNARILRAAREADPTVEAVVFQVQGRQAA